MWFVVLGQAACMVGEVLVGWRLRVLGRVLVWLPTYFMVVRLACILSDGPLIMVMQLVTTVRHAALVNWNKGVRSRVTVFIIRARVWPLAMLGFDVRYVFRVPGNMLVFASLVIRAAV